MNFRDAFLGALASNGIELSVMARKTGVSQAHLESLSQHPETQTSVEDARKIAAYFGQDLEAFLAETDLQGPIEIVGLYSQLPDHVKHRFQAYGSGRSESPGSSEPE